MSSTPNLNGMFDDASRGAQHMMEILHDPQVQQITVNRHDLIWYVHVDRGPIFVNFEVFPSEEHYIRWLNQLLGYTDAGITDLASVRGHVVEASLAHHLRGSIHIATKEITRGEPVLTVRKQPIDFITLDHMMVNQQMLSAEMHWFLQKAMYGRLNILISGGSGAGKTTMARALASYIDPEHRICTAEEIDELHLGDRLRNVVAMTTYREKDDRGVLVREVTLEQLVKETLRMRPDRIWVGETRGREAYALVKAANSGHDGSVTTIHADDGRQAVKQLISYVMEDGLPEQTASEQVMRAFDLVVQINKVRPDRRAITEITELTAVVEGTEQRQNVLFKYDFDTDGFVFHGDPSPQLVHKLMKNGVNYHDAPAR